MTARNIQSLHSGTGRLKTVAAVLVTVLIYLSRSGDGFTHPQLYAEDGRVFLTESITFGPKALLVPYAGYLHFSPRVSALLARAFPASLAPEVYFAFATGIVAATAAAIATAEHPRAWLLASTMLLVPLGGDDVFGTLTNAQWFSQAGLVVVTATASPRGRPIRVGQCLFVLCFALTGPFSIFAAPLAAWKILQDRTDKHAWTIGVIVVACALVQAGFILREPSPYEGSHEPWHLARLLLERWIGRSAHRGPASRAPAVIADVGLLAALLAALSIPLVRRLLAYSLALLASVFSRFTNDSGYFDVSPTGERYFYMPRLAVLWSLLLLVVRFRSTSALGVLGLAMMASSFGQWVRTPLPILPWGDEASKIDRGEAADILINPSSPDDTGPDLWKVEIPGRPPRIPPD